MILNPNIKTKYVIADFSKCSEKGFTERIDNEIHDLDVSILINNVGVDLLDRFEDHSEEKIV